MMAPHKKRVIDFLFGEESILDLIFRMPPKKPDSRMYFLGGCGFITVARGLYILFGRPPQGQIFTILGEGFIIFWACVWVFIGLAVMIVAGTGHWRLELDRAAAFLLMALWWIWALFYVVSMVLPNNPDRLADFLNAIVLSITGLVLSAGIILGIRKTQEIRLKDLAISQIKKLEIDLINASKENTRLHELLDKYENIEHQQSGGATTDE